MPRFVVDGPTIGVWSSFLKVTYLGLGLHKVVSVSYVDPGASVKALFSINGCQIGVSAGGVRSVDLLFYHFAYIMLHYNVE